MSTSYDVINCLETIEFIAGNIYTLNFTVYENDGTTLLDMTGGSTAYRVAPLGEPDNTTFEVSGTVTGIGLFNVVLGTSDTQDISGVFIGQPRVTDFGGDLFIPAQGKVIISPDNIAP